MSVHLWGCIVGTEFRHINQIIDESSRDLLDALKTDE